MTTDSHVGGGVLSIEDGDVHSQGLLRRFSILLSRTASVAPLWIYCLVDPEKLDLLWNSQERGQRGRYGHAQASLGHTKMRSELAGMTCATHSPC
jgi:hypothetical protein